MQMYYTKWEATFATVKLLTNFTKYSYMVKEKVDFKEAVHRKSEYTIQNKMDNSLLAVRNINHKYIVVGVIK